MLLIYLARLWNPGGGGGGGGRGGAVNLTFQVPGSLPFLSWISTFYPGSLLFILDLYILSWISTFSSWISTFCPGSLLF